MELQRSTECVWQAPLLLRWSFNATPQFRPSSIATLAELQCSADESDEAPSQPRSSSIEALTELQRNVDGSGKAP